MDIEVTLQLGTHFDNMSSLERNNLPAIQAEPFKPCQRRVSELRELPTRRFSLGVTLDAVRTMLADWIYEKQKQGTPDTSSLWAPPLPSESSSDHKFVFDASDYICGLDYNSRKMFSKDYFNASVI